ncbi:MAG: NAD-dependent epimerase/dehydratase family protein [Mycetocola sp.]
MLRKLQSVSSSKGGVVRILIIGGTRFLGRHLVEAALARNHEVTLFNRGKVEPRSLSAI